VFLYVIDSDCRLFQFSNGTCQYIVTVSHPLYTACTGITAFEEFFYITSSGVNGGDARVIRVNWDSGETDFIYQGNTFPMGISTNQDGQVFFAEFTVGTIERVRESNKSSSTFLVAPPAVGAQDVSFSKSLNRIFWSNIVGGCIYYNRTFSSLIASFSFSRKCKSRR